MKLKKLVNWAESGGGNSPAFWIDQESGDFYFQGYKVTKRVRDQANCPGYEDLVRVPASFWEQLKQFAKVDDK